MQRLLLTIICLSFISNCAQYQQRQHQASKPLAKTTHQQQPKQAQDIQALLKKKPDEFLYMAGKAALEDGNIPLAINFLKTLNQRSTALLPRLTLAQLQLQLKQPEQAATLLHELLPQHPLKHDADGNTLQLHQLYAEALLQSGKEKEAIEHLRPHLAMMPVRIQLCRLLLHTQQTQEAKRLANEGLRIQKHPGLLRVLIDLALTEKKLKQAIHYTEALSQLEPNNASTIILYSAVLTQAGKQQAAEKALKNYLQAHPAGLSVANQLGRLLISQRRINEAMQVYRSMLRYSETPGHIHFTLGMLHYEQQQFQAATDEFQLAVEQQPENDEYHFYRAVTLDLLKDSITAEQHYRQVPATSQRYGLSQIRIAAIHMRQKDFAETEKVLLALLKKQPELGDAWSMLSAVYLEREAYQKVISDTQDAMSLAKIPNALLINRAIAFDYLKRYDELEQNIQQILKQDPDHAEALNFIAYSLAERGIRLQEAEQYVRKALALHPDNGFYLDSLAWIYYQQGQYVEAEKTQRTALKQVVRVDPIMLDHLGDILWRQGQHEKAKASWQQALKAMHENQDSTHIKATEDKISHGLP